MKICIISNSHQTTDVRLYHKLAISLTKMGKVHLICASGVRNAAKNPYQEVVATESAWQALPLLYKKAKKLKPDIVICVEPLTVFVGLLLRRKTRCKVIFDVHEFFPDAFAERFHPPVSWIMKSLYLGFERWLQSRMDATMAVSKDVLDQLVPPEKQTNTAVIQNYPVKNIWEQDSEIPMELNPISDMEFDLVYVGGLTPNRGVFKILKSVSFLKREFPNLNVLIVGKFFDPEAEKQFNQQLNKYSLNAVVYYQDWVAPDKIGFLLKRSKIGLWIFNPQNSRLSKALPLKVLEYFAAGLPVVATRSNLMRKLVEKNELGACCEYSSESIAKAVAKLLRLKKSEYRLMSKRCEDIIEEKYNWEAVEPKLLTLMEKLAARP